MPDQVVTCLQNQMTFVEDVDVENHIVFELFRADKASLSYLVFAEVVNPDLSNRIPHDEEATLHDCTGRRVDLLRTASEIIDEYLIGDLASPVANPALPQPQVAIKAAGEYVQGVLERLVDQGEGVDGR